MKIYKKKFLNDMMTNLGISEKQFRDVIPNDEDLLFGAAEILLQKRKIKVKKNITLYDFINSYDNYRNNNAELLTILQAIELSADIKKLNETVAKQRVNAFKKIIEGAIINGEISKNAIELLKVENIINLFFEIIDDRVVRAEIKTSNDNGVLYKETKKLLDIYYKFLSKWDEKEDKLLKFAKFVLDYDFKIKECIMDQTLMDIISTNAINYDI